MLSRIWKNLLNFIFILSIFIFSCGPSIKGTWKGTGEIYEGRFFNSIITFLDEKSGRIIYELKGMDVRNLPVCKIDAGEYSLSFVVEGGEGAGYCNTLSQPLLFKGTYGESVIAGEILGHSGKKIGIFRLFKEN
jgi:hypothetical protein